MRRSACTFLVTYDFELSHSRILGRLLLRHPFVDKIYQPQPIGLSVFQFNSPILQVGSEGSLMLSLIDSFAARTDELHRPIRIEMYVPTGATLLDPSVELD